MKAIVQATIYGYKESILRLEAHLYNENDSRKRSAVQKSNNEEGPYEFEVELEAGESFLIPEYAENIQVTVFEQDGESITRIAWTSDKPSPSEYALKEG